jgi:hypothetical protein
MVNKERTAPTPEEIRLAELRVSFVVSYITDNIGTAPFEFSRLAERFSQSFSYEELLIILEILLDKGWLVTSPEGLRCPNTARPSWL